MNDSKVLWMFAAGYSFVGFLLILAGFSNGDLFAVSSIFIVSGVVFSIRAAFIEKREKDEIG